MSLKKAANGGVTTFSMDDHGNGELWVEKTYTGKKEMDWRYCFLSLVIQRLV